MADTRCSLQWKGTSVCLDLWCSCRHQSHVDGWFVYNVRCPDCGAVYKLPDEIPVERVDPADDDLVAMDQREPIIRDGAIVGSMGGDGDGIPWAEMKLIPSFREAREGEGRG